MNTGEGNVMGNVESALPKDVAESMTYKVPSEYVVGLGDTSLESWLTPSESQSGENQQTDSTQTPSLNYDTGQILSVH